MVDYRSQEPGGRPGRHTQSIVLPGFLALIREIQPFDAEIMLKRKEKKKHAIAVMSVLCHDERPVQSK